MSRKTIGLGAVTAAAILPIALAAQQYNPGSGERGSSGVRYNLMQLSVERERISAEEFKSKTREISSCYDGKVLADELDAKTARNRNVFASQLPEPVQNLLKDLPTGQATPVFSADGSVMRVLIICSRG